MRKEAVSILVCVLVTLTFALSAGAESETYAYETQELWAQRDENRIYGLIYIPQNAGEEMPAVIISHGFGGSHRSGAQYAQALAAGATAPRWKCPCLRNRPTWRR